MAGQTAAASDHATLLWVYGVVAASADTTALAAGSTGVLPDAGVETVAEGGLAAVVTRVSRAEFGEEQLRASLEDLLWLEQKARAHNDVLERALEATALVPFRFCTIFDGDEDVRAMLRHEAPRLEHALERLAGRVELGVKAFVSDDLLVARLRDRDETSNELASATGGRRYLLEKRREQAVARAAADFRMSCARETHSALAALAEATRINPPQRAAPDDGDGDLILNGAYLVA